MNNQSDVNEHLKQTARDLVLQFTGFELMHDWPALTELGSGVRWIDLDSGRTHHDGRTVPPLVVTSMLQAWLRESLAGAGLSKTDTQDASLTAHLRVERYAGQRHVGQQWPGGPTEFVGCRAEIRCRLAVGGHVAEASSTEVMEWPDSGAA
jgi:hypothetical protein